MYRFSFTELGVEHSARWLVVNTGHPQMFFAVAPITGHEECAAWLTAAQQLRDLQAPSLAVVQLHHGDVLHSNPRRVGGYNYIDRPKLMPYAEDHPARGAVYNAPGGGIALHATGLLGETDGVYAHADLASGLEAVATVIGDEVRP